MRVLIVFLCAVCATVSSQAISADTEALQGLMQKNNCTACHLIEKRKYGPKFKEVAEKYAGEPKAGETLAAKIKAGGAGVWGEDMMPPQPHVSDADARAIADLILSLK